MAELKAGDRVSHKRRGCRREYGTVVEVLPSVSEPGEWWARVRWDHGPVCLWLTQDLKVEKAKVR